MSHGHHHNHAHGIGVAESSEITRRITRYAVGVAFLLLLLKIYAWRLSDSVSLLASLADSALDLIASLITFWAVRYAATPPDARHRFGHGKAEAFASLIQGGLVCASSALVAREAIGRLLLPQSLESTKPAIAVMALSILLTGLLVAAQTRAVRQTGSVAVAGDRLHYATDVLTNLVALIGIVVAVATNILWVDAAAGLFIAAWLLWGAIGVFRAASAQLMDQELADEARERIIKIVNEDPRIQGVHGLRTRASGPTIHIQLHADLDPNMTLIAAHDAIVAAEKRLTAAFPSADIIIHADPKGVAEPHGPEEISGP